MHQKNLIYVHHFSNDNHASLDYFPNHFLVKDMDMRKVLLKGQCMDDLYPIPASWRQAFGTFKPTLHQWHSHLGHPSLHVIEQLVKNNSLLYSNESSTKSVCDACQQAKSHQLPYPVSTSISSKPLELIFSVVWGPAPNSIRRKKYYVSFIDDFSKFTWVYLHRFKSEVF
jgi:hypothetical protein